MFFCSSCKWKDPSKDRKFGVSTFSPCCYNIRTSGMSKGIKKSSRGPTFGPHPRIECQKSWKGGEGFRCLIYGRYLIHCHVLVLRPIWSGIMVCLEYVAMKYQERPWLKFFVDPPIHSRLLQNAMLRPVAEEQLKKEEQRQRKRESHLRTRILSRMGWKLRRSPGHDRYADRWLKSPHCGKTDDVTEPVRDSGVDANLGMFGSGHIQKRFRTYKVPKISW